MQETLILPTNLPLTSHGQVGLQMLRQPGLAYPAPTPPQGCLPSHSHPPTTGSPAQSPPQPLPTHPLTPFLLTCTAMDEHLWVLNHNHVTPARLEGLPGTAPKPKAQSNCMWLRYFLPPAMTRIPRPLLDRAAVPGTRPYHCKHSVSWCLYCAADGGSALLNGLQHLPTSATNISLNMIKFSRSNCPQTRNTNSRLLRRSLD